MRRWFWASAVATQELQSRFLIPRHVPGNRTLTRGATRSRLRPFGLIGIMVLRVRRLIIDRAGKVLHQIHDNPFRGQDTYWTVRFIDYRQMAISSVLHPANGGTHGVFGRNRHRFRGHAVLEFRRQRLRWCQDTGEQIPLREDADDFPILGHEQTPYLPTSHQFDGIGHGAILVQLVRWSWSKPGHTIHPQVPRQFHASVSKGGERSGSETHAKNNRSLMGGNAISTHFGRDPLRHFPSHSEFGKSAVGS